MNPPAELSPSSQFLLDEIRKLFSEHNAELNQLFADRNAKWDQRWSSRGISSPSATTSVAASVAPATAVAPAASPAVSTLVESAPAPASSTPTPPAAPATFSSASAPTTSATALALPPTAASERTSPATKKARPSSPPQAHAADSEDRLSTLNDYVLHNILGRMPLRVPLRDAAAMTAPSAAASFAGPTILYSDSEIISTPATAATFSAAGGISPAPAVPATASATAASSTPSTNVTSVVVALLLPLDSCETEEAAGAPADSFDRGACLISDTSASICARSSTILSSSNVLVDSSSTRLAPRPRFMDTSSSSGFCLPKELRGVSRGSYEMKDELQLVQMKYADEACKLTVVQMQFRELTNDAVSRTLPDKWLMNCLTVIPYYFSLPFSYSWDAVICWQHRPWPPPSGLQSVSCEAELRPLPWPSFDMVERYSVTIVSHRLWKPPWYVSIQLPKPVELWKCLIRLGSLAVVPILVGICLLHLGVMIASILNKLKLVRQRAMEILSVMLAIITFRSYATVRIS